MNLDTWSEGKVVLDEFSKLNKLIAKETYTDATKQKIIDSLKTLGLKNSDESKFVILRQNHGHLLKRSNSGLQIVAEGRDDWIGWLELKKEAVNEIATQMTAKVIQTVNRRHTFRDRSRRSNCTLPFQSINFSNRSMRNIAASC